MLKKTITYIDYNGQEQKEDFYFNLSKAEVVEMEMSTNGGLAEHIQAITNARKGDEIVALFKDLVLKSYGEKSPDGKRFVKSEELRKAFEQTEAYSELFIELSLHADKAAEFVNGIIPQTAIK